MELTRDEEDILKGNQGNAAAKSMKILVALGEIYGAKKLIPINSVQIAGVSFHNLGDPGLEYLDELAKDGRTKVTTTLNPAGMDLKDWKKLGISEEFASKQHKVIAAFSKMGVITCCTCTPYLVGNLPRYGEHIAWSESSAVTFINSVVGAYTNKEGGPSAIASAMIGKTPEYGLHLDVNRVPNIGFKVEADVKSLPDFGALGYFIGNKGKGKIPFIAGIKNATLDELKAFGASVVTYGSKPIYHMESITPDAAKHSMPSEVITVTDKDLKDSYDALNDVFDEVKFVSLGCPHCSIDEIRRIAEYLEGKKVNDGVELWIATARPTKVLADIRGYTEVIEATGAKFACDTCMVVAPLKGRFENVATTSAKACFYCRGKNKMQVKLGSFEKCLDAAVNGRWS
ncbi:MAG: aconitase X catalytic domain-containing protein [Candidatus Altiarchaeota archaeon]|nr:aconitase X catalytic domain-containing protein [Candidatus Altiarchaeota archaeon]